MFATFTSQDGIAYNYVATCNSTVVQACTQVDFGTADTKGRKVGMSRAINHEVRTLRAEAPAHGGSIWPVGKPLERYVGFAHTLRNGEIFGGSNVRVYGATEAEVAAELDARIERARKVAVKKHA